MFRHRKYCTKKSRNTFGVGIVRDGKILADAKDVYKPKEGYGIIPMEAAKHHSAVCDEVLKKALKEAKINLSDIDIIAFSAGPGLPPCLRIGANFTETLALRLKKPLVGVSHCIAHIEIGKLTTGAKDPIIVYLSGGNSQIIAFVEGRYQVFGETEDLPLGNAFDIFAREAGLEFPGGPKIEQLAKKGKYIKLPYTVKGCDMSFSGIITEALRQLRNNPIEDVCFSLQETAFAMLVEVTERAVAHTGKNEVLLTGGVAANKRLQEMLEIMCKERGARFFTVPKEYAGDCGVNIAWTGILAYKSGQEPAKKAEINSRWRTDEVDVKWL